MPPGFCVSVVFGPREEEVGVRVWLYMELSMVFGPVVFGPGRRRWECVFGFTWSCQTLPEELHLLPTLPSTQRVRSVCLAKGTLVGVEWHRAVDLMCFPDDS